MSDEMLWNGHAVTVFRAGSEYRLRYVDRDTCSWGLAVGAGPFKTVMEARQFVTDHNAVQNPANPLPVRDLMAQITALALKRKKVLA